MPITEADFGSALPIDGYGPGFFRVGGVVWRSGVVVHAEGVTRWNGYDDLAPLVDLAGKVDLLFVGTGAEIAFLSKPFLAALDAVGMMCEPMASPSAARSYNVLLSEGRSVGAALLPVPDPAA